MTRILTLTALLVLATVALAQPPSAVANRIFDRLYADQVSCGSNRILTALSEDSEIAYCAYVYDTLTDINQRLVNRAYESMGWREITRGWTSDWMDTGEIHMNGYTDATLESDPDELLLGMTSLILFYELDSTIVIVTFESLD